MQKAPSNGTENVVLHPNAYLFSFCSSEFGKLFATIAHFEFEFWSSLQTMALGLKYLHKKL